MNSERKRQIGRHQLDAMAHYSASSKRGDKKNMRGAIKEIIATGKRLGSKATGLDNWAPGR